MTAAKATLDGEHQRVKALASEKDAQNEKTISELQDKLKEKQEVEAVQQTTI